MAGTILRGFVGLVAAASIIANASLAQDGTGECPPRGTSWTKENLQECIDKTTRRIDETAPGSAQRATLLAQRAELHKRLGFEASQGPVAAGPEFDAAIADLSAALEITPGDEDIRHERANLLLQMGRGEAALDDARILLVRAPESLKYLALKGYALDTLKRHEEAVQVYTGAIALSQSCAEASMIQRQVNEYRRAFDPPMTKEQMLKEIEEMKSRPLYDVPDPPVAALGFPCKATPANTFADLVQMKATLFHARGESHRAMGDAHAALTDFRYAASISTVPDLDYHSLCILEIELQLDYDAAKDCRRAFDFNVYSIPGDPQDTAKIAQYLLEDGDLKGACRLVFLPRGAELAAYASHPAIRAVQERLKPAMKAAGMTGCERPFRPALSKGNG